jgi:hypothetical protein
MATVTGKLESVTGGLIEAGSVEIALCGYGSFLPSGPSLLIARPTSQAQDVPVDPTKGTFTATVTGNDQIEPAGTYYTVTIKDANGDIVQCAAYLFLGSNTYDLSTAQPFDPTQPPPVIPPLIISQLLIVPYATPVFDGADYTAFEYTLLADSTGATCTNMKTGNLYTFIIIQDATGGRAFQWPVGTAPSGTKNQTQPVCQLPNSTTVQTFVAIGSTMLMPIGPGTYIP